MSDLEDWGREIYGTYETKHINCEVVIDEVGNETYLADLPNGMRTVVNVEHRDDMFLKSIGLQMPENVSYDNEARIIISKWSKRSEFRLSPENELNFVELVKIQSRIVLALHAGERLLFFFFFFIIIRNIILYHKNGYLIGGVYEKYQG